MPVRSAPSLALVIAVVAVTIASVARIAGAPPSIDAAFQKFWAAKKPDEAAKAAQNVVAAGVSCEEALARLKRGRTFSPNVKRGIVRLRRTSILGDFFYDLDVPESYDPSRAYPVRVQLHGGVMMRASSEQRGRGASTLKGAEQFYIMPTAWRDAPWWSRAQVANIDGILDSVKRTYNVDENHVALAGVSDGATGVYYYAMRDTTPFSSFVSLNGFLMVLANESVGA